MTTYKSILDEVTSALDLKFQDKNQQLILLNHEVDLSKIDEQNNFLQVFPNRSFQFDLSPYFGPNSNCRLFLVSRYVEITSSDSNGYVIGNEFSYDPVELKENTLYDSTHPLGSFPSYTSITATSYGYLRWLYLGFYTGTGFPSTPSGFQRELNGDPAFKTFPVYITPSKELLTQQISQYFGASAINLPCVTGSKRRIQMELTKLKQLLAPWFWCWNTATSYVSYSFQQIWNQDDTTPYDIKDPTQAGLTTVLVDPAASIVDFQVIPTLSLVQSDQSISQWSLSSIARLMSPSEAANSTPATVAGYTLEEKEQEAGLFLPASNTLSVRFLFEEINVTNFLKTYLNEQDTGYHDPPDTIVYSVDHPVPSYTLPLQALDLTLSYPLLKKYLDAGAISFTYSLLYLTLQEWLKEPSLASGLSTNFNYRLQTFKWNSPILFDYYATSTLQLIALLGEPKIQTCTALRALQFQTQLATPVFNGTSLQYSFESGNAQLLSEISLFFKLQLEHSMFTTFLLSCLFIKSNEISQNVSEGIEYFPDETGTMTLDWITPLSNTTDRYLEYAITSNMFPVPQYFRSNASSTIANIPFYNSETGSWLGNFTFQGQFTSPDDVVTVLESLTDQHTLSTYKFQEHGLQYWRNLLRMGLKFGVRTATSMEIALFDENVDAQYEYCIDQSALHLTQLAVYDVSQEENNAVPFFRISCTNDNRSKFRFRTYQPAKLFILEEDVDLVEWRESVDVNYDLNQLDYTVVPFPNDDQVVIQIAQHIVAPIDNDYKMLSGLFIEGPKQLDKSNDRLPIYLRVKSMQPMGDLGVDFIDIVLTYANGEQIFSTYKLLPNQSLWDVFPNTGLTLDQVLKSTSSGSTTLLDKIRITLAASGSPTTVHYQWTFTIRYPVAINRLLQNLVFPSNIALSQQQPFLARLVNSKDSNLTFVHNGMISSTIVPVTLPSTSTSVLGREKFQILLPLQLEQIVRSEVGALSKIDYVAIYRNMHHINPRVKEEPVKMFEIVTEPFNRLYNTITCAFIRSEHFLLQQIQLSITLNGQLVGQVTLTLEPGNIRASLPLIASSTQYFAEEKQSSLSLFQDKQWEITKESAEQLTTQVFCLGQEIPIVCEHRPTCTKHQFIFRTATMELTPLSLASQVELSSKISSADENSIMVDISLGQVLVQFPLLKRTFAATLDGQSTVIGAVLKFTQEKESLVIILKESLNSKSGSFDCSMVVYDSNSTPICLQNGTLQKICSLPSNSAWNVFQFSCIKK